MVTQSQINRLQRFYECHRQALFTYALSLTGQSVEAEDLLHNVFAKLLEKGKLPLELRPYVFRMVRNGFIDAARKQKVQQEPLFDFDLVPADSPSRDLWLELESSLEALGEKQREVIVLKSLDGLSFREVANVLDKPMGTVVSLHRRGMEKLKNLLNKEKIA